MSQFRIDPAVRRSPVRPDALRSERGAFLIETIVGALLVAVVAVAMLSAFDGADKVSGRAKMRALAASLAQSDQERLRSMPEATLNNLRQTNAKYVDGVRYDVASRSDWVADDTSTTDCTNNGSAGDYMKITSSVSSPSQPTLAPVVVSSIVTPAPGTFGVDQGSLAVTVVDRNGNGLSGLSVSITGPANASDVTDSHGCAFFGYQPIGSYTASTTRAGYVDTQGNTIASKTVSIASQQMSTAQLQYDQAGSAGVSFDTLATDPGGATRTVVAPDADARYIRASHNLLLPPYYRTFGDGADHTAITATNLFPFTSAYGIYAGNCDDNDPNKWSQTVDSVQVNPSAAPSLTVREPAVNVHVIKSGVDVANPHVKITAVSPCSGTWNYVAGTDTNANGTLKFPGLPYGTYNVCADNVAGNRKISVANVANTARGGTAVLNMDVSGTGSSSGVC